MPNERWWESDNLKAIGIFGFLLVMVIIAMFSDASGESDDREEDRQTGEYIDAVEGSR